MTEGHGMNLAMFWRLLQAHAHAPWWLMTVVGALPLALLHWLALRASEG